MTNQITQSAQITRDVIAAAASAHAHMAPGWTAGFLLNCATRRAALAVTAANDALSYPAGSVVRRMHLRHAEDWMVQAIADRNNAIGFASK